MVGTTPNPEAPGDVALAATVGWINNQLERLREDNALLRTQRAALWELVKDRVRAVIRFNQLTGDLYIEVCDLLGDNTRLRRDLADVRAERDTAARQADLREREILELIDQRDRLEARLSALDSAAGAGVTR